MRRKLWNEHVLRIAYFCRLTNCRKVLEKSFYDVQRFVEEGRGGRYWGGVPCIGHRKLSLMGKSAARLTWENGRTFPAKRWSSPKNWRVQQTTIDISIAVFFAVLLLLHSFNSCYCPVAGEGVAFKYFNSCWMARWCRREWQESCSSRSDKALLGWWPWSKTRPLIKALTIWQYHTLYMFRKIRTPAIAPVQYLLHSQPICRSFSIAVVLAYSHIAHLKCRFNSFPRKSTQWTQIWPQVTTESDPRIHFMLPFEMRVSSIRGLSSCPRA